MQTQTPPPRSSAGNGHRTADEPLPEPPPLNPASRAFQEVPVWIAELKSYFQYFLSAKVDGAKAKAKQGILYAVLGVVALLILAGILFSATFLVLNGLAMGLGRLLGSRLWLGDLIVGLVVLGAIVGGAWIMIKKLTHASRLTTEKKYESKQLQQRAEFGHDVHHRGGASGKHGT